MILKNNKGVAGTDIAIAIGIIIIFSSLIAGMFYNVDIARKEVSRKAEATFLAIQTIETLKGMDYNTIPDDGKMTVHELQPVIGVPNGYKVDIEVVNYRTLKNDDTLKNIIKKVKVVISYNSNLKDQMVELETIIVNTEESDEI